MAITFTTRRYTDDEGSNWSMRVAADLLAGATNAPAGVVSVGGAATDGSEMPFRGNFKPRCVLLWSGSTKKLARRVIAYTHDAPIYVGTADTLALFEARTAVAINFRRYGYEGERRRHSRPSGASY